MTIKNYRKTSWRDTQWENAGYYLEYRVWSPGDTPDTGWYLYGPKGFPFGDFMDRKLENAKEEASRYLARKGVTSTTWERRENA